mmetsp:Transcript_37491/g.67815  ORF Transcript_37491/g.67815 Transcript_37491/m.67815 type:complete len:396 (-) Transcript_37491:154-1341(-)
MELDLLSRVIFPRPPPTYTADHFPGELLWVPRSLNPQTAKPEDCVPLCLLQRPGAKCLILYFHSNFEDIGRAYLFCRGVRDRLQAHVLIVEYPSYGICPGDQCDEHLVLDCARLALRFVKDVLRCPRSSIVLMGRSIGTGVATQLAAEKHYGGLVLISPFNSIKDLVSSYIGPAASFITERFPNKENIAKVTSPCLFVHGKDDSMIPFVHCQQLFEACGARKTLALQEKMDHNSNLLMYPAFLLDPLRDFLGEYFLEELSLNVPSWAFDKQMCPQSTPSGYVADSQLTCWAPDGGCGVCHAAYTDACKGPLPRPQPDASKRTVDMSKQVLEATISKAVEHSLLRPPGGEVMRGPGEAKRASARRASALRSILDTGLKSEWQSQNAEDEIEEMISL